MEIRVVLVDDHSGAGALSRQLLQREDSIDVVGEADNGREAIQLVRQLVPDVVVMDVNMPSIGGIDATRKIKREFPDTAVVGFSTDTDEEIVSAMLRAGANGYVVKSHARKHLARSIRAVHAGRFYLSFDGCSQAQRSRSVERAEA